MHGLIKAIIWKMSLSMAILVLLTAVSVFLINVCCSIVVSATSHYQVRLVFQLRQQKVVVDLNKVKKVSLFFHPERREWTAYSLFIQQLPNTLCHFLPIKYFLPKKLRAVFPNLAQEGVYKVLQTVANSIGSKVIS